jgi:uncharacterized membrane protein
LHDDERDQKEEDREKAQGPVSRKRIESLSDLMFGLALSVGALALIAQPPTTPDELTPRLIAFIFNFVVLIAVWLQYTMVMSRMPVETGRMVLANAFLLLLIILMSYLINEVRFVSPPLPIPADTPLGAYSSQLYGLVLAGVTGILSFFSYNLSIEEKHLIPRGYLRKARSAAKANAFFCALFLFTALPQAWDWSFDQVPLRFALWWIPLIGTIIVNAMFFRSPKSYEDSKDTPTAP